MHVPESDCAPARLAASAARREASGREGGVGRPGRRVGAEADSATRHRFPATHPAPLLRAPPQTQPVATRAPRATAPRAPGAEVPPKLLWWCRVVTARKNNLPSATGTRTECPFSTEAARGERHASAATATRGGREGRREVSLRRCATAATRVRLSMTCCKPDVNITQARLPRTCCWLLRGARLAGPRAKAPAPREERRHRGAQRGALALSLKRA